MRGWSLVARDEVKLSPSETFVECRRFTVALTCRFENRLCFFPLPAPQWRARCHTLFSLRSEAHAVRPGLTGGEISSRNAILTEVVVYM